MINQNQNQKKTKDVTLSRPCLGEKRKDYALVRPVSGNGRGYASVCPFGGKRKNLRLSAPCLGENKESTADICSYGETEILY